MKGRRHLPRPLVPALLGWLLTAPGQAQDAPEGQDAAAARGTPAQTEAQASPAGYTRRHALIIGIDEYEDPAYPDLGYAVADAKAVAKVLVERFGFEQDDVRLLVNGDASSDALEDAFEVWTCDSGRIQDDDLLVVFYAGHGVTRDVGARGLKGYLVPADGQTNRLAEPRWGTLLDMDDLKSASEIIPAKHALFVLDCCFGGLAINRDSPPIAAGLTSRARQVITAGDAQQTVLDTGGRQGHSVFTGAILDALEGEADLDGDTVITFGELFNHVGRDVERKTEARQTPLQATFPDHEGGSVAFFPPGTEPSGMTAADRLKSIQRSMEEKLAELERMSDLVVADQLLEEQGELYPAWPKMVRALRDWLSRARELASRRSQHEESVRLVRQEAYLSQVVADLLEEGSGSEPLWDKVDQNLSWRFKTFTSLVDRLHTLDMNIADVEGRLSWAMQIEELTLNHPNSVYTWEEAREAIAAADGVVASELYAEHPSNLTPQLGLVPIGMNPETLLWEFYDLRSAFDPASGVDPAKIVIPEHREDGSLEIRDETGLVFVLIPGGKYMIGAQSLDPGLPNYDPHSKANEAPVHELILEPYLLSRYEMTQGQWLRVSGRNPSNYGSHNYDANWNLRELEADLSHPVEQVSWEDCVTVLNRIGFRLPSEAQWEAACRAKTTTPWWAGSDQSDLFGVGNLADKYGKEHGASVWTAWEGDLNDGNTVHARVGSYRANPYGLHDTIGNVWEWCLDGNGGYNQPGRAGDHARNLEGARTRMYRGGCFNDTARLARSARRSGGTSERIGDLLGCRPASNLSR